MDNILNVNTQFKKEDIDVFLASRKKPYLITTEQVGQKELVNNERRKSYINRCYRECRK